jgi:hypothetical protein
MVFGVIGIGFESDVVVVERTIDTNPYLRNMNRLGFIDALDQKHDLFDWVFQQGGAPCHTSQSALHWLEESVDLIVD